MANKKDPRIQAPGTRRPQAARMQPVVRNASLRNSRKPKGSKNGRG